MVGSNNTNKYNKKDNNFKTIISEEKIESREKKYGTYNTLKTQ